MRTYKLGLLAVLNLIFSTTLLQLFRIFDVVPNTALIIIVLLVIHFGFRDALIFALFAGVLHDLFISLSLGPNVLIFCGIALIVALIEDSLSKANYFGPGMLIMLSTIIYHGVYFVFMYFLRNNIGFGLLLYRIVPVELIYNVVLTLLIYGFTAKKFADVEVV